MTEQITIEVLKNFRTDFAEAVKDLEEKYGVNISIGNISYTETSFHSKLEVTLDSVSPFKKYEDTFNILHQLYGLDKSTLGTTFKSNGITMKFVGLDSKKRNYPCICTGSNGKRYKMSTEQLKLHLKQTV
jgi:hypothetical protein